MLLAAGTGEEDPRVQLLRNLHADHAGCLAQHMIDYTILYYYAMLFILDCTRLDYYTTLYHTILYSYDLISYNII